MFRRSASVVLAALAFAACQPSKPTSKGEAVAKGNGILITTEDFKARLDEQSPFIRARYQTLERKKEFLDNLIRFEVLANEAEKQGLAKDPEVQLTLKKVMVQKLVQKNFQDTEGAKDIPEADLQKFYDEHKDEYYRPRKVRLAAVVWNAPAGSPERAAKKAAATKALAKLQVDEKKNSLAFAQVVSQASEDPGSKALAGDLGFRSKDELAKTYGQPLADAAFSLQDGQTSGVLETEKGLYLVKVTGHQDELNRPFDQVKTQIANRLHREKKSKEFDEWLKKLRADAGVTVDDKVLEAIPVAAAPGAAGMPGMPPGVGGMPPGHGMAPPGAPGAPAPAAPRVAPAPPPAPGSAQPH